MPLFWLSTAFLLGLVLGAAYPLGWNAWEVLGNRAFKKGEVMHTKTVKLLSLCSLRTLR